MPINDPHALTPPLREAAVAWLEAGKGAFYVVSGLRTRQEQIDLRVTNGCPDIWTSSASSCRVPTAIPGTSRHETGLAVDVGGDKVLAKRLAPQFGLGLTVPGEDWHFEVVNEAVANTYPKDGFTMAEIDRIIDKLDDVIKSNQRQENLTRTSIRRQALLTRHDVLKAANAEKKLIQAVLDELAELGPEEAQG